MSLSQYTPDSKVTPEGYVRFFLADLPLDDTQAEIRDTPGKAFSAVNNPEEDIQRRISQGGIFRFSEIDSHFAAVKRGEIVRSAIHHSTDPDLLGHDLIGNFDVNPLPEDIPLRVFMKVANIAATQEANKTRLLNRGLDELEDVVYVWPNTGTYKPSSSPKATHGYHQAIADLAREATPAEAQAHRIQTAKPAHLTQLTDAIRAELTSEFEEKSAALEADFQARVDAEADKRTADKLAQIGAILGTNVAIPTELPPAPATNPTQTSPPVADTTTPSTSGDDTMTKEELDALSLGIIESEESPNPTPTTTTPDTDPETASPSTPEPDTDSEQPEGMTPEEIEELLADFDDELDDIPEENPEETPEDSTENIGTVKSHL